MANIITAYTDMWKNFANFSGRTNVPGYWLAALANFVISTVLTYIPVVGTVYGILAIVPGLALCVRRLHDAGKSGWFLLINLIPLVGQILMIIALCKPSKN